MKVNHVTLMRGGRETRQGHGMMKQKKLDFASFDPQLQIFNHLRHYYIFVTITATGDFTGSYFYVKIDISLESHINRKLPFEENNFH